MEPAHRARLSGGTIAAQVLTCPYVSAVFTPISETDFPLIPAKTGTLRGIRNRNAISPKRPVFRRKTGEEDFCQRRSSGSGLPPEDKDGEEFHSFPIRQHSARMSPPRHLPGRRRTAGRIPGTPGLHPPREQAIRIRYEVIKVRVAERKSAREVHGLKRNDTVWRGEAQAYAYRQHAPGDINSNPIKPQENSPRLLAQLLRPRSAASV